MKQNQTEQGSINQCCPNATPECCAYKTASNLIDYGQAQYLLIEEKGKSIVGSLPSVFFEGFAEGYNFLMSKYEKAIQNEISKDLHIKHLEFELAFEKDSRK